MLTGKLKGNIKKAFSILVSGIVIVLSVPDFGLADTSYLQSGPMVGYSEMNEVLLWVQTNKAAKIKFKYWDKAEPSKKYFTDEIPTSENYAYTAKVLAKNLKPGKKYSYELFINSQKIERPYPTEFQTQTLWQWRTDPPNFKIALGSCAYISQAESDRPGKPYGRNYEIFTSIYNKRPDAMLWTGDNIYLREPDWNTRSGILYRYTHTRSLPEIQPLLASTHNYALWDDHDFGPNDSDRGFRNKYDTLEGFKLFWGNQTYGLPETPGTFTKFEWADTEFFFVDNRMYKTPDNRKTGKRVVLGDVQFEWLIDSLVSSNAKFKFVFFGGQVLNPVAKYENYAIYPEERAKLIDTIEKENIQGVIFVSGDRHQTELSVLKREENYPLYDLTVSPLTSEPYDASKEDNYLRVPGTIVVERNFATLDVSGSVNDRKLKITVFNKDGKELWNREIKSSEINNR